MSALSKVKVAEWGQMISAPYCSKVLADLGAEVVKIEAPLFGDTSRQFGPFPNDNLHPEKSGMFLYLNSNKRSVTLDPSIFEGREIFLRIIEKSDVFVVNQLPNVLRSLKIGYDNLVEINPELVMVSITPFGYSGKYSEFKGYDSNCAALSGLASLIGDPKREPLIIPLSQCDFQGGINAAAATIAALIARNKTSKGQFIDISVAEVMASYIGVYSSMFTEYGLMLRREGHRFSRSAGAYPFTILPCKDGEFLLVGRGWDWERFVKAIGEPDWTKNPRYQDRRKMGTEYPDEVDSLLGEWLQHHTKDEIWALCLKNGIPYVPLRKINEVVEDVHLKERGFYVELDHRIAGRLRYPGAPYKLSKTPWKSQKSAPLLGEHNEEEFCGLLGVQKEELKELHIKGAI